MIAHTVLPWSMMKEVLGAFHGGSSGRYLSINKNMEKVRQRYCWLHGRSDIREVVPTDYYKASRGP
jgi:hypothetical protein